MLIVLLVLAACWPFAGTLLIHRGVFRPTTQCPPLGGPLPTGIEEARYSAPDGPRIVGYFVHAAQPRRAVVFFHGNIGTAWNGVALARAFTADGTDVLLGEFRGYGRSDGSPSLHGIQEDGDAAVEYLLHDRHIAPDCIVVIGQSLGGAMAAHAMTRRRIAGGILVSTFGSFRGISRLMLTIPDAWALDTTTNLQHVWGAPIAIFHGTHDDVIPVAEGRALYANAPGPKEIHIVEGGTHNLAGLHRLTAPVVERFAASCPLGLAR